MPLPLISIISALSSLAPSIGKFIAGDKGEQAAQEVANIARAVTGQNDVETAVRQVQSDPESRLKFLEQYNQHEERMSSMYLADVQHAREHNKHSLMPAIICCFLSVWLVAFGGCLMFVEVPEANQRIVDTLFGSYLTAWLSSIAYWVGSSRGSAEKDRRKG